jgi:hypothetical protein
LIYLLSRLQFYIDDFFQNEVTFESDRILRVSNESVLFVELSILKTNRSRYFFKKIDLKYTNLVFSCFFLKDEQNNSFYFIDDG